MIVKRWFWVIIGLVLLISSSAAINLSPSTISSSNTGWLIANDGNDQSTITVYALAAGTLATPVTGATVTFSLNPASQDLGTISPVAPASAITGADGKATTIFTTLKKSGTATIIATISVNDGITTPVQVSTIQLIDHDIPQGATFENPPELPVGSITSVIVTLVDRWGNRIDNKNTAETIRLTMADDGSAGLQEGESYVTQKTYSTDAEGNVSAGIRISTAVKSNYIQMDPIGNIVVPPGTYIQGVAGSKPYFIAQTPASPGSSLPADGLPESAVEIYYTVNDKYNNPITGASLYCSSTDGMSVTAPTNTWGRLRISFGPKETIGIYTLKAVPLGNSSAVCTGINAGTVGYCSQDIEYYNTAPVDLTFTGNPQSMTSLDVDSTIRAILQARVIDIKGNPVIGENVTFSLAVPTYPGGPYNVTAPPILSTSYDKVGASGYATTLFSPGRFAVYGAPGYNQAATGQVVATATWTNKAGTITKTREVTLVWKNYPYISTSSLGDCGNSQVGDKINITIQLKGDGAALGAKPIDVVLCTDRSGSMMGDNPDRMVNIMGAATAFVDQLVPLHDQIGVVSFGQKGTAEAITYSGIGPGSDSSTSDDATYRAAHYSSSPKDYAEYATVDRELTLDKSLVKTKINSMVPYSGTPLRDALRKSIQELTSTRGRSDTVKAVVVLTDGDYNYYGDPLARGTGYSSGSYGPTAYGDLTQAYMTYTDVDGIQNMALYAKSKGIKIYTIGYGSLSSGATTTLSTLASSSDGKSYTATSSNIADVYTAIAGDLQETAGGETEIALNFGTVMIDDNPLRDIRNYMDYVYESHSPARSSDSTYINKSNITKYGVYHQLISETRNDKNAWDTRTMAFDVGTIKLNETWSATFRLNLTQAGKIDLFGPNSSISFTDASTGATQMGFIPAMQCRIRASIVNPGFGSKTLRVDNLSFVEGASPDPNVWTLKWNTTYDGNKTVQEAILYRVTGGTQWKTVPGGLIFISTKVFEETKEHTISTSDTMLWPPGKCFDIQIVAGAEDANAAMTNQITKCKELPGGTIFIKLE